MSTEYKAALIGFQAFTGNEYFGILDKGKGACWKILLNNLQFWRLFAEVERAWISSDNLIQLLEEFVRLLFGSCRLIDLCLLPPCKTSLHLYLPRACYVAKIWRESQTPKFELPLVYTIAGQKIMKSNRLKLRFRRPNDGFQWKMI